MINAPIQYIPAFVDDPVSVFDVLWAELPWERRPDAPRRECWMNDFGTAYTYGSGKGVRTYVPVDWHPTVKAMQQRLLQEGCQSFEGCFINGYEGPRDHLGWHADDSPEIDPNKPIAVISFGSSRRIWFRETGRDTHEEWLLEPGSLLLMLPGMQQTHQHRIPKHSADCGPRISLTFRGLVAQQET